MLGYFLRIITSIRKSYWVRPLGWLLLLHIPSWFTGVKLFFFLLFLWKVVSESVLTLNEVDSAEKEGCFSSGMPTGQLVVCDLEKTPTEAWSCKGWMKRLSFVNGFVGVSVKGCHRKECLKVTLFKCSDFGPKSYMFVVFAILCLQTALGSSFQRGLGCI